MKNKILIVCVLSMVSVLVTGCDSMRSAALNEPAAQRMAGVKWEPLMADTALRPKPSLLTMMR